VCAIYLLRRSSDGAGSIPFDLAGG
jgi:hypothetical protein